MQLLFVDLSAQEECEGLILRNQQSTFAGDIATAGRAYMVLLMKSSIDWRFQFWS